MPRAPCMRRHAPSLHAHAWRGPMRQVGGNPPAPPARTVSSCSPARRRYQPHPFEGRRSILEPFVACGGLPALGPVEAASHAEHARIHFRSPGAYLRGPQCNSANSSFEAAPAHTFRRAPASAFDLAFACLTMCKAPFEGRMPMCLLHARPFCWREYNMRWRVVVTALKERLFGAASHSAT